MSNKKIKIMAKIIDSCWLSPNGEVFWCSSHTIEAESLIDKFYSHKDIGPECDFCVERFLELRGWIKYFNHSWCSITGWVVLPDQHLTERQREKIFELTGEWIEDWGEVHFASPFLYYNYIFSFAKVTYLPKKGCEGFFFR